MTSVVDICNLATSNIRAGSISSLSESSIQALQCNLKYELCRDMVLAELPWGFARTIEGLGLTTEEIFNWTYAYQYPADCLKINRLIGSQEELQNADADVISRLRDADLIDLNDLRVKIPYEVFNQDDNRIIGANDSDLRIDYTRKVDDPSVFSTSFIFALSHLLAAEIAIPVAGVQLGSTLRKESLELYRHYLAQATADDLNEQYRSPQLSELETIRR